MINYQMKDKKDDKQSPNKDILAYADDDKQTLFKVFGIEMTAPKGLKYPRVVYISFVLVNFILLILLKNLISNQ